MKKIFNRIALMAALVAGINVMIACSEEDDTIVAEQSAAQVISVELGAELGADTRATYATGTKTISPESGDALYVSLSNGSWSATGTLNYNGSKFSGDLTVMGGPYSGTNIFADATSTFEATLLPNGYATPAYLSNTGVVTATKAFAAGEKAAVVPQVAHVTKTAYNSSTNTITLTAQNAVFFYTLSGLTASTEYGVAVTDGTTAITGSITADGSGNASFAVGYLKGSSASVKCTVEGKTPITVTPSAATKAKVYNVTRDLRVLTGLFTVGSGKQVYFS